jgi:hypothetical protein
LIALLDDDDIWLPDKLAIQQRYLEENPACDAVQSAAWAFFTHGPDELWGFDRPSPLTLAAALTGECTVIPASLVARKELFQHLGSFDERFRWPRPDIAFRQFPSRWSVSGARVTGIFPAGGSTGLCGMRSFSGNTERFTAGPTVGAVL